MCLHTGHGNEDAKYTMYDLVVNTTVKENNLGLTTSANTKVSEQCGIAPAKVNKILDKPKGFLVHLPSRVDSIGGNLVKC